MVNLFEVEGKMNHWSIRRLISADRLATHEMDILITKVIYLAFFGIQICCRTVSGLTIFRFNTFSELALLPWNSKFWSKSSHFLMNFDSQIWSRKIIGWYNELINVVTDIYFSDWYRLFWISVFKLCILPKNVTKLPKT